MEYLTPDDIKLAAANGIPEHRVRYRFYTLGWSKRRSTTQECKRPKGLWPQYRELCKEHGVSETSFYHRVQHGMAPEEAATRPKLQKGELLGKKISMKITPEAIAEAMKNGISESTLKHRVYKYKWTVERAMTEPINSQFRRKDLETVSS